jgi:hypothetical protein
MTQVWRCGAESTASLTHLTVTHVPTQSVRVCLRFFTEFKSASRLTHLRLVFHRLGDALVGGRRYDECCVAAFAARSQLTYLDLSGGAYHLSKIFKHAHHAALLRMRHVNITDKTTRSQGTTLCKIYEALPSTVHIHVRTRSFDPADPPPKSRELMQIEPVRFIIEALADGQ